MLAASVLVACGCLFASQTEARVCFATDPDCGSGGNFSEIDPKYMSDRCLENGYTSIATDCQNTVGMQIGAYCPYDHKYVICCGLEYAYTKCTPPLKAAGVCGGKLKCECDTSKFAYMQKTASVCRNVLNGTEYENSRGDGGSCSYMGYDHASQTSTINIRFAECTCDRGLYPKTEEECSSIGASTAGNVCTDSNGNNFYSSCLCGPEYKYISSDCKYGTYVKDPLCQQGDVYKTKRCCDCNSATYPYADYGDIDEAVKTYADCEHERGCTRGSRYRATSCNLGYKLGSGTDSGKCVPKTCGEIIQDYLTDKKITTYQVYQAGKTPTTTNVIVGDDTNGAYWSNFSNKNVISGQVYATTIYGSEPLVKLIKNQCTAAPLINVSSGTNSSNLNFTGVELQSSSLTHSSGTFTCTNCGINITTFNNKGTVNLAYNASKPNADNMYVKLSSASITGDLKAEGYNFEITGAGMRIENTYGGKKVVIKGLADRRLSFKATTLSVRGFAMMRYMNATTTTTCLGVTCSYSSVSNNAYFNENDDNSRRNTSSSLNLYDTTYNIANGGKLVLSTSSKIGQSSKEGGSMPETGRITFAAKTVTNLYMGSLHHKGGWGTWYGSVDQNGTWQTVSYGGYGWDYDGGDDWQTGGWMEIGGKSSRSKKQPRNFVCYVDYNGLPHKLYGSAADSCKYYDDCKFGDNDGDNRRYYIRHDGHGYTGSN